MRRRNVQDHSHCRVRLCVNRRTAEHPVDDPGKLPAGDNPGRVGSIPVDPTTLCRKAESRPGIVVRIQVGKDGCGFCRGIVAAQQAKQFRSGYLIVRIEPVPAHNAQVFQRCGGLEAAVIAVDILKRAFPNAVQIQQFVQNGDQFPHCDRVVHTHNAVVID